MSGAVGQAGLAPLDGSRTARVAAVEAAARNRRLAICALRIVVGIAFLGLWYVASGNWIDTLLISSPQNVAARLWRWTLDGTLWSNLSVTLEATILGFAIGCGAGSGLGLLFGRFQLLAEVFDPYITAIYSIPKSRWPRCSSSGSASGWRARSRCRRRSSSSSSSSTPIPGCAR